MSNQITGRMIEKDQTVQIPSKNGGSPFLKREFLLNATTYDTHTGERSEYENILPLEVTGDKCAELDQFQIGDVVTVYFALQGRSWTNQDDKLKRMTSIRCYKLEARRQAHQQAVQPAVQTQQQPVNQQTSMPPQFPPEVDANGNPKDDLPF